MTALPANDVVLVPIRSGVGFQLGANLGYLKFTPHRPGIRSATPPREYSADPLLAPFDARPAVRPELERAGWVRCETEVMS
jgi:Envelope integrity protein A